MVHRDPLCLQRASASRGGGATDNWLLVFTQSRRRAGVLHPPQDPLYRNMLMRSADEGRSWSRAFRRAGFRLAGVECAGLTALRSGVVAAQPVALRLAYARPCARPTSHPTRLRRAGTADGRRGHGGRARRLDAPDRPRSPSASLGARRRRDLGASLARRRQHLHGSTRIDTAPFSGGYGMRGGIESRRRDRAAALRRAATIAPSSRCARGDGGESWSAPSLVATGEGHAFEEPAPLLLRDRPHPHAAARQCHAHPARRQFRRWRVTWSAPAADRHRRLSGRPGRTSRRPYRLRRRTPAPALRHYALICPRIKGDSWNAARPIFVRSDLPNRDLGYPTLALRVGRRSLRRLLCAGSRRRDRHSWQRSHARR